MKLRLTYILVFTMVMFTLAACDQADELIGKVNQLLDQQLADNEEDNSNNNLVEDNDIAGNEDDVEEVAVDSAENNNESDEANNSQVESTNSTDELPFDDRLRAQGYTPKVLPNGFPFEVPYHWILVDESGENFDQDAYESKFCFDMPLEIEEIASQFDLFDEVSHESFGDDADIIHKTTFAMDFGFTDVTGVFDYFYDEHGNTCVNLIIDLNQEDREADEQYGEDPSTMVSEEELAAMQEAEEYQDDANSNAMTNDEESDYTSNASTRERTLPNDYDAIVEELKNSDEFLEQTGIESIRDKIAKGEFSMLNLANGHPVVFPYEWYLMKKEEDHGGSGWNGAFCTDANIEQTLVKHLDMLADLEADINELEINYSGKMNQIAKIEFAFNDIYGTGSWQGSTLFHIDRLNEFQTHKCALMDMEFSPELLD